MAIDNEVLNPLVESNARIIHSSYPNLHQGDISQEMWMWVYGNQRKVKQYVNMGSDGLKLIGFRLRSIAHRYAAKELAFRNGVDYEDMHVYTVASLRVLLSDVFDYEDWQSHQVSYDDMPKAKAASNTTGDRIAMLADVSAGLSKLQEDHYNMLVWVYKLGWSYEQLGEYLDGISADAARKRTDRAVGKLRSVLMGIANDTDPDAPEFVGTRRAVSNATAMSYQANRWDG